MITSFARVELDGIIILPRVLVHIIRSPDEGSGMKSWGGHFSLPKNSEEAYIQIQSNDAPLTLVLENNLKGLCNWTDIRGFGAGAVVEFKGTGKLE